MTTPSSLHTIFPPSLPGLGAESHPLLYVLLFRAYFSTENASPQSQCIFLPPFLHPRSSIGRSWAHSLQHFTGGSCGKEILFPSSSNPPRFYYLPYSDSIILEYTTVLQCLSSLSFLHPVVLKSEAEILFSSSDRELFALVVQALAFRL
jgi:hypothetical protein